MQIEIKVFTEEEKYLVHQRTMELLSQTGVWIKSDKAFFALKEAGASIDEKRRGFFSMRRPAPPAGLAAALATYQKKPIVSMRWQPL